MGVDWCWCPVCDEITCGEFISEAEIYESKKWYKKISKLYENSSDENDKKIKKYKKKHVKELSLCADCADSHLDKVKDSDDNDYIFISPIDYYEKKCETLDFD